MGVVSLVYLAAPYSHPDPMVVEERMITYCRVDSKLLTAGMMTISPLMKHYVLEHGDLLGDWGYWQNYAKLLLLKCDVICIICMDGWKESEGVQAEIEIAKNLIS